MECLRLLLISEFDFANKIQQKASIIIISVCIIEYFYECHHSRIVQMIIEWGDPLAQGLTYGMAVSKQVSSNSIDALTFTFELIPLKRYKPFPSRFSFMKMASA